MASDPRIMSVDPALRRSADGRSRRLQGFWGPVLHCRAGWLHIPPRSAPKTLSSVCIPSFTAELPPWNAPLKIFRHVYRSVPDLHTLSPVVSAHFSASAADTRTSQFPPHSPNYYSSARFIAAYKPGNPCKRAVFIQWRPIPLSRSRLAPSLNTQQRAAEPGQRPQWRTYPVRNK